MNRFHVHLNVSDIDASVRFYSALFAASPSVLKHDYAKWMLDDPRVNFAISATGRPAGIDHLGLQADDAAGLADLGRRLEAAGGVVVPEEAATCCYAKSEKAWTADPQGTRWETFHTIGSATSYSGATDEAADAPHPGAQRPQAGKSTSCCGPKAACC